MTSSGQTSDMSYEERDPHSIFQVLRMNTLVPEETRKTDAGEPYEERDPASLLNERREAALAELDDAKFGWFHIKVCLVAGIG